MTDAMWTVIASDEAAFEAELARLARRGDEDLASVEPAVRAIVDDVASRGDVALRELTAKFEGRTLEAIRVPDRVVDARAAEVDGAARDALVFAADRIARYHERQKTEGFSYEEDGVELGVRVSPMRAAGVYAPGGKARYPSTVLMAAVPARVAGVRRIVLATPSPNAILCAAARIAGVTEVVDLGGAQAIAALALGTESLAPVDVVVGPGNLYVACAKKLLAGRVAIDGIAGPSEILVVADETADPAIVAADLLSQAEHDEAAYPLLVCTSRDVATRVETELASQLASLPRREIAQASLAAHGRALVVRSIDEALEVTNRIAPEHLALQVRDPRAALDRVTAAGAIFVGAYTPEAAGDYVAGPSHVLPTGGAARFTPPLGVWTFVVRSSVIRYGKDALRRHGTHIETLARLEGLEAHARAVTRRLV